jgi:hypothetical protein
VIRSGIPVVSAFCSRKRSPLSRWGVLANAARARNVAPGPHFPRRHAHGIGGYGPVAEPALALVESGADDGNRTRVFSLGTYFQRRTSVLQGLLKGPVSRPKSPGHLRFRYVRHTLTVRCRCGCGSVAFGVRTGYRPPIRQGAATLTPTRCMRTGAPRGQFCSRIARVPQPYWQRPKSLSRNGEAETSRRPSIDGKVRRWKAICPMAIKWMTGERRGGGNRQSDPQRPV